MTIYEVIEDLWTNLFPALVITEHQDLFNLITLYLTFLVVFTFILFPLWHIATFWLRSIKRRKGR